MALRELPAVMRQDLAQMARAATSAPDEISPSRLRWLTPRRLVVGVAAVLALALATPLVAGINPLDEIAQLTGIREHPPSVPSAGYQPADVPYVSVQPLMRYLDSDKPVVPWTALVTRNGGASSSSSPVLTTRRATPTLASVRAGLRLAPESGMQ